jgi:hypothetical protein
MCRQVSAAWQPTICWGYESEGPDTRLHAGDLHALKVVDAVDQLFAPLMAAQGLDWVGCLRQRKERSLSLSTSA